MKEVLKTVYVTFDGKEFSSKEDAARHERLDELREFLDEAHINWYSTSPAEAAEYLLANSSELIEILKAVK